MATKTLLNTAPTDRAAALLSGVRNDLATGGVCAAGYVRFAAQNHTVDAETLAEARRLLNQLVIYTVGYQRWNIATLKTRIVTLGAQLVDIRTTPWSQRPDWRKDTLRQTFSDRYTHCAALGNVNYKNGGPIQLAAPETAVEPLRALFAERPIVLLCGCHDWHTCHRSVAADYLGVAFDARVQHLEAHS